MKYTLWDDRVCTLDTAVAALGEGCCISCSANDWLTLLLVAIQGEAI